MVKSQKNENLPRFVMIFGILILAMIAFVFLAPLFKEPTQEPKTGAHSRFADSSNSQTSSSTDVNRRYLLDVIRNHPRTEVSETLWPQIESGDIQVQLLNGNNADGRFRPAPLVDIDGRLVKLLGTFSVSKDEVAHARLGDPASVWYLLMIILHEAVHYEQISTGRFPSEIITSPGVSREDCLMGWQLEREAYYRECEYAMSVRQSALIQPFCSTLEADAFDRALYWALRRGRMDGCPSHWVQELATNGT